MAKKPTHEELEQRVKKQGDAIDLLALAINQMGKEIRAKQEELT